MLLYGPERPVFDLALPPNEAYGWVVFSIPWRGRQFGLVVLTDGRWFMGTFIRVGAV
jgi:hypothetical protein